MKTLGDSTPEIQPHDAVAEGFEPDDVSGWEVLLGRDNTPGLEDKSEVTADIFRLMLFGMIALFGLALVLIFFLLLPALDQAVDEANTQDGPRRAEQLELRANAEELLGQYARSETAEGRFRIPVDSATALLVASSRNDGDTLPKSRARINVAGVHLQAPPASSAED